MMIQMCRKKISKALKCIFLFSHFMSTEPLASAMELKTDVSATEIISQSTGQVKDCEGVTIDRRMALVLKPMFAERSVVGEGTLLGEAKILEINKLDIFHRNFDGRLVFSDGGNKATFSGSKDFSNQILWGCAASIAARLRREQKIREDLQVDGDNTRADQRMVGFETANRAGKFEVNALERREIGAYSRVQRDVYLSWSASLSDRFNTIIQVGMGDENIRSEHYKNLRSGIFFNYKATSKWTLIANGTYQKRGAEQRIYSSQIVGNYQASREVVVNLETNRIMEKNSPRFPTYSNRFSMSHTLDKRRLEASVGRTVAEDGSRNGNNIFSLAGEDIFGRWHKLRLRLIKGTEFVAIVQTSDSIEAGYSFNLGGMEASDGRILSAGLAYTFTRIVREAFQPSNIRIMEIGIKAVL